MRVISGSAGGTKLFSLEGLNTRPTLDKVKEAIFSIVQRNIPDAVVLDLFSGSGSMGIEAVSRGALCAALVDSHRASAEIIKKNVEKTRLSEKIDIFCQGYDIFISLKAENYLKKTGEAYFTLVFLDPPYGKGLVDKSLEMLSDKGLIGDETVIVCEGDLGDKFSDKIGEFVITKSKKYGKTKVVIYTKGDLE